MLVVAAALLSAGASWAGADFVPALSEQEAAAAMRAQEMRVFTVNDSFFIIYGYKILFIDQSGKARNENRKRSRCLSS